MLNADSSTLKSESDAQRRARPPMIPRVAALSCTLWTRSMMRSIGVPGSVFLISRTRKDDSSALPVRPSNESDRKVRGTKERRAKYAIIAARCGPRSAKNFCRRSLRRTRMPREYPYASRNMDAQQALADLTEISSQIEAAVVFDDQGKVAGSTPAEGGRADDLAKAAAALGFYDLKSALRSVKPAAKSAPAKKKTATAAKKTSTAASAKKKTAARKPATR